MDKKLVLKTVDADGTSYGGFLWPLVVGATVEAPDWDGGKLGCGGGLHGLLWGEGDGGLLNWSSDATWLVVEAEDVTEPFDGKVKFRRCKILHVGDQKSATDYLVEHGTTGAIVGVTATAGNGGTATAGYRGTATAGDEGTATAGYRGTATAGNWGTAIAGNWGTATAGYKGTATAGDEGTATAGDEGTATAGYRGTATAGDEGTATAGDEGTVILKRWNGKRYRFSIGYVGEDGIKPDTPYRCDEKGKLVEVKE